MSTSPSKSRTKDGSGSKPQGVCRLSGIGENPCGKSVRRLDALFCVDLGAGHARSLRCDVQDSFLIFYFSILTMLFPPQFLDRVQSDNQNLDYNCRWLTPFVIAPFAARGCCRHPRSPAGQIERLRRALRVGLNPICLRCWLRPHCRHTRR